MITVKDFLEVVNYRITDSSQFQWNCFGDSARYLHSDYDHCSVRIIFDTETQQVYELAICEVDPETDYRWIHPNYREDFFKEEEDTKQNIFYTGSYINIEESTYILEIARSLINKPEQLELF